MKRFCLGVLAIGCLLLTAPRPAAAQGVRWGPMVGLLMPMGDYADFDNMGWTAGLGVSKWMPTGNLGFRVDASYGQTPHDGGGGNTKLFGGMVSVLYGLQPATAPMRVILHGGLGMFNVDGGAASETKIGFGGGVALAFKMGTGNTRLVVATRYTSVSTDPSLTFLPITVGLSMGK